jgi:hypothetical protein
MLIKKNHFCFMLLQKMPICFYKKKKKMKKVHVPPQTTTHLAMSPKLSIGTMFHPNYKEVVNVPPMTTIPLTK